jgi:hypothetical protein
VKEMKYQRLRPAAAMLLGIAMIPAKAWPQSQAPSDETQALRKPVQQMQTQMGKMQAEIDQLKGTKPESAQAPPAAAPATPAVPQDGSIESVPPQRETVTSEQVGSETAERQEFSEDATAVARWDNLPLDPKFHGFFRLPGKRPIGKCAPHSIQREVQFRKS